MKRREFLQCAAVLAAGASTLPSAWSMNHEQKTFLAAQASYIDRQTLTFFTPAQREVVAIVAEHVIPRTETPGAKEAGVPRFIELMVSDWFNEDERKLFMDGLASLQQHDSEPFVGLPASGQLAVLEQLEEESADASWYDIGNVLRVWDEAAPFICQLKELTVLGYFLSEVGAKQTLRINPMGEFKGDIPLAADDPAYASQLPMRMIAGE